MVIVNRTSILRHLKEGDVTVVGPIKVVVTTGPIRVVVTTGQSVVNGDEGDDKKMSVRGVSHLKVSSFL